MNEFKKIGLLIIGWTLIGLGILGLFLPVLQGLLFIMIGLAIICFAAAKQIKAFSNIPRRATSPPMRRAVAWRLKLRSRFKKS